MYAGNLPRARFLRFTPAGDLLVSRPHKGDILLLRRDADGDGHPDAVETLIDGLKRPLGMDLRNGYLYIAESNRIGRLPFDAGSGTASSSGASSDLPLGPSRPTWAERGPVQAGGALRKKHRAVSRFSLTESRQ